MDFNRNDGGNPKGVSDCVPRALSIILKRPYYEVAQELAPYTTDKGVNVYATGMLDYMEANGFRYVQALTWRSVSHLPGTCIAHTANHWTAVVDGTVQDTVDTRLEMVRGYWVRGNRFNVVAKGVAKNTAPLNFAQALQMRRLLHLNYTTITELQTLNPTS